MRKDAGADVLLWATLYRLKKIPRTGWLDRGIPTEAAESVADHSHLTSLLAWVVASGDDGLDAHRVLELATIHDVAETIMGDWAPYEPHEVPKSNHQALKAFFSVRRMRTLENASAKRAAETQAAARILALLPTDARELWRDLWQEYDEQSSPEARFVKQVDRLEAFIQSRLYAREFPDAPVRGFTDMAMKEISHPALVPIRDAFLDD